MRKLADVTIIVLAFLAFYVCAVIGADKLPDEPTTTTSTVLRLEEDDSRWDCHTMGNRVCGPESDRP